MASDDAFGQMSSERFHALRKRLVFYFRNRGFRDPDELAQEVIARAWFRHCEGASIEVELENYCYGIARYVLLERLRENETEELPPDYRLPTDASQAEEIELRILAKQILRDVPEEQARIVEEYYKGAGKDLAQRIGISHDNLRLRVFRTVEGIRRKFGRGCEKRPRT